MNTKMKRFFEFINKGKMRELFALALYVLFIVMYIKTESPLVWRIFYYSYLIFIMLFGIYAYIEKVARGEPIKIIIGEIKTIGEEILNFIPIWLISSCVVALIMVGKPANQVGLEEAFYKMPILKSMLSIIIAPIIEEFVFRLLPHRFIKSPIIYVVISTVVFAAMHVINDPNPFYYIWFYIIISWYYGYRYYKTKDILVSISIHSFNNLIATLLMAFA